MPTPAELKSKLWTSLKSDRTIMLGLADFESGHMRPMSAQCEEETGTLWIFTASDTAIAQQLKSSRPCVAAFASKGHDVFATIHGVLSIDNNRTKINDLWNPIVAAWFEGGKEDPKLTLLRFDAKEAEIWLDGSSLLAGIKMLLGADPKEDYKDNVAKVRLG